MTFRRTFGPRGAAGVGLAPGAIDPGQTSIPRDAVHSSAVQVATSRVYLTYFMATRRETLGRIVLVTGTTAGAGITLCRLGAYRVEQDGSHTLIASTPNDPTVGAAANTRYIRSTSAPFTVEVGRRYAAAFVMVATTMPLLMGSSPGQAGPTLYSTTEPALVRQLMTTSDLPATITAAGPATAGGRVYQELLP